MADELERVRKALRELRKTLKSLPSDPPPKEVHKLRTTTRRVEAIATALPLNGGKKSRQLLKSIETIRKTAGGVRDMDVLSAHARRLARFSAGDSLARLLAHLKNAREQYAAQLHQALDHKRKAVRQSLKEYSKLVRSALPAADSGSSVNGQPGHSHDGVHTSAMSLLRELAAWPALDASNIHAFRLKVKELRYTLQLDADADPALVDTLTVVQRRIGDWHDWQELLAIAREVLVAEQDAALLARIDQTARRRLSRALAAANGLRAKYLAAPIAQGA
jgi:CHAD domain-containing protein